MNIQDMRDCVYKHLEAGGHNMAAWRVSAPYDTHASTRAPVYAVSFQCDDVDLPSPRYLVVREGWELRGGMEHGTHLVSAMISMGGSYFDVDTEQDLQNWLSKHVPVGPELSRLISDRRAAEQAKAAEQRALSEALQACIRDDAVDRLVDSVIADVRRHPLPLPLLPLLRTRVVDELNARVRRRLQVAFDALGVK